LPPTPRRSPSLRLPLPLRALASQPSGTTR
jgi:hypothetical protein